MDSGRLDLLWTELTGRLPWLRLGRATLAASVASACLYSMRDAQPSKGLARLRAAILSVAL